MGKIGLVVPTIREVQIREFLISWWDQIREAGVCVYIVEDNETKTFCIKQESLNNPAIAGNSTLVQHLSWSDAPDGMLDCIMVKSPGCRQIGYWKAYCDGCEIIVTLDDDVRPASGPNLFEEFYDILIKGIPVWADPLLNYRSRGYPVRNVGTIPVAFHVGSFLRIPDVDGETQLKYQAKFANHPPKYIPKATIVPSGQLIPVNGGICGWKRDITPFVHYALWNKELGYRRFDDIWMGVVIKRFFDQCKLNMSYGQSFVNHIRASIAEKNAEYEREGKRWNEVFWEIFNKKCDEMLQAVNGSRQETYEKLAQVLQQIDNAWSQSEGLAMLKWLEFFKPLN